jgi:uncharacterized protein (TIGR02246 family)
MKEDDTILAAQSCLDAWAQAFNTRDPEQLVVFYADDALLHGTSSAKLYVGIEEIRTYFRGNATVTFGKQHVLPLAADTVLAVGHYVFSQGPNAQQPDTSARFTFVLRRSGDAWKILHHHSSADPT